MFISVLSEESLLLFLYLIFLKHETKTGKSLTEYNHSKREWEGGKQGGACLQGLLQLWSLPLRAFTRMILIRLTGVGANCLGIRTQKRRAKCAYPVLGIPARLPPAQVYQPWAAAAAKKQAGDGTCALLRMGTFLLLLTK